MGSKCSAGFPLDPKASLFLPRHLLDNRTSLTWRAAGAVAVVWEEGGGRALLFWECWAGHWPEAWWLLLEPEDAKHLTWLDCSRLQAASSTPFWNWPPRVADVRSSKEHGPKGLRISKRFCIENHAGLSRSGNRYTQGRDLAGCLNGIVQLTGNCTNNGVVFTIIQKVRQNRHMPIKTPGRKPPGRKPARPYRIQDWQWEADCYQLT